LFDDALAFARGLARRGLSSGDTCVVVSANDETSAKVALGVLLSDAVLLLIGLPVFLDGPQRLAFAKRLAALSRKVGSRLTVVPRELQPVAESLGEGIAFADFLRNGPSGPVPATQQSAHDVTVLQLTSGTTRNPRVCVWRQEELLASLDGAARATNLQHSDICFSWLPLYHDMGLVNAFLLSLTQGIPLALLSPQDFVRRPCLWMRGISETRATFSWSPNFGFALATQQVHDEELRGVQLDQVRALWNGAERIHMETVRKFGQRFASLGLRPGTVKASYGCTENIGGATFGDPTQPMGFEVVDAEPLRAQGIARPVSAGAKAQAGIAIASVGRAAPRTRIGIFSPRWRPLPDGQVGEIGIQGPSRMSGYLGNARETRRATVGAFLRTGDLGYLRDGELFWVGRLPEQIVMYGQKYYPSDLQEVFTGIPDIRPGRFGAFGVDDPAAGTQQLVVAAEVTDLDLEAMLRAAAEIRRRILRQWGVGAAKVLLMPKGALSKTSSGKQRHRHLRDQYLQGAIAPLRIL
jgi:acyl-CoA synthetase (AMP-forming)/AMP-acid ligase II